MRRELTKDKISIDQIDDRILLIRGWRVMIDSDLAALYAVSTGRFNEQVKRNLARFPADFMFQLTKQEVTALRSQIAISNERLGRGGRRYLPYAFTEHGAIMAATILNTSRATEVSVYVGTCVPAAARNCRIEHGALEKTGRAGKKSSNPRPDNRRPHTGNPPT